ncbi:polysaccharide biosynthesis tyrosine autokinase [uncultured Flavobacterium sp.]|uniref:GumC family protein n=1 Tax=uncultured Flavobacterium sp. TaxID=165435 RepID=UPI0030CA2280
MQDQFDFNEEEQGESILELLSQYIYYWKWFVLCVLIAVSSAFILLRYSTPVYQAASKIIVRDEKKGNITSELSAFADMGLLSGMANNVDNEIEILNSITLVEKAIKRLNFTTTYFRLGNVRDVELYKNTQPFEFVIENASEVFYNTSQSFTIEIISPDRYELSNHKGLNLGTFSFGSSILLNEATLKIQKLPSFSVLTSLESYNVFYTPLLLVGEAYQKAFSVEALSKTASVVNLSITSTVPKKAEDFLDTLVAIYNEEAIKDKNAISEVTLAFIKERLGIISTELGDVEIKSQNFKIENKLTDISTDAKIYLETHSEFEINLIETETQLRVLDIMIDFMNNKGKTELVPVDIVPKMEFAGQINPFIIQHNNLVLQRNRILNDGTKKNFVLTNLEQQLEELDRNIKQSLTQYKSGLIVKRNDLDKQESVLLGKIKSIPTQEREFRILDRQQKIKEGIYLYLIQKREETAITLSVQETNAKIIDFARANQDPIAPKKRIWYLAALLIGLGFPFLIIYLVLLFDNKIGSEKDVELKAKNIPLLGSIPSNLDDERLKALKTEAFRTLMQNANFIAPEKDSKEGRIIMTTSSKKGEGKTYIAYNLALAYANLNKKTIIIGVDFRNPQLHKLFDVKKEDHSGFSNYLHDDKLQWQDLIFKFHVEDKSGDVLLSGDIPPNPQLLLSSKRFENLMTELKMKYDIIILDTAPILLVSDTLIFSKFADITLYVLRCAHTEKDLVNHAVKLVEDKKLHNIGFVVNDLSFSKNKGYGYGYSYSYGYVYGLEGEEQIPWYKTTFLSKFFNNRSNTNDN